MKFSITTKKCLLGGAALLLVAFGASCGNTMYGMGLDMERAGRRLQTSHDPNATTDYSGASTGGGTYYPPPNPSQPAPSY